MLFQAKLALRSVCDITPELLGKLGVRGLLLDIDNTLTTHDNPTPAPGVEGWVRHAETQEELVVYRKEQDGSVWAMPKSVFTGTAHDNQPRFTMV